MTNAETPQAVVVDSPCPVCGESSSSIVDSEGILPLRCFNCTMKPSDEHHMTTPLGSQSCVKRRFIWCDDSFATQEKAEKAIAAALVDYLCNGDAGSVEYDDQTYCLSITVDIIDDNGNRLRLPHGEQSSAVVNRE